MDYEVLGDPTEPAATKYITLTPHSCLQKRLRHNMLKHLRQKEGQES